jgi:hypothetical protein
MKISSIKKHEEVYSEFLENGTFGEDFLKTKLSSQRMYSKE